MDPAADRHKAKMVKRKAMQDVQAGVWSASAAVS
jgi:hypothetical protein